MALRYLARRALQQRALVPRVPQSAGSRLVSTSGSSPPHQGLLINESKAAAAAGKGNKGPELQATEDLSKLTPDQICQKLLDANSMYRAAIEDLIEVIRYQEFEKWCMLGSVATGTGLALLHIAYDMRNQAKMIAQGASSTSCVLN